MSPEETLERLKKTVHSRSHRSLEAIFEVCKEQLDKREGDFSYATIAKLGEKRGVPRAQSIRNKTGEAYRTLIDAFAKSIPAKAPKLTRADDDWIDRISDPSAKLLVRMQAAELKNVQRKLKEFLPINSVIHINDFSPEAQEHKFSDTERRALEYLVSAEFLQDVERKLGKLTIGQQGQMMNDKEELVFKIATVDAIKKALKFLS